MFRIDSEGATIGNRYTEGDPQLAVAATVVSDEALNSFQEEIIKPIEEMDIVLDKGDEGQLYQSMLEMALRGGRKLPVSQALANNSGPLDVVGFEFDKTLVATRIALYTIERKTDTQSVQESGIVFCTYNSKDDNWRVSSFSLHDDAGVEFSTSAVDANIEKLEYTTNDLTGTTYSGNLSLTSLIDIRI